MAPTPSRTPVLIIDGNPSNLRVVIGHLEAYALDILTALDGETGLDRARRGRPDLILLDVQLPGIDGFETCRRLKANPETSAIPVIFMTASAHTDSKLRGFEVGGVDYVTKPISAPELVARVKAHLELRSLSRQLEARAAHLEGRVEAGARALEEEAAQRLAYQRERARLIGVIHDQSVHLRALTRQWAEAHLSPPASGGGAGRAGSRAELIRLHLTQLRRLLAAGQGDPALVPSMEAHLDTALSLLEGPAAEGEPAPEPQAAAGPGPMLRLSQRELEVLQLMAAGRSNKEIAYELDVARSTVSTYRARIMEKLEVEDTASLLKVAILGQVGEPASA